MLTRQPKPLGRGVWILDASERNNLRPRLEIGEPGPRAPRLVRDACLWPVPRDPHDGAGEDGGRLPVRGGEAMLVGRSLGIGDADVNLQTIERASRELRGYGPSLRLLSGDSR